MKFNKITPPYIVVPPEKPNRTLEILKKHNFDADKANREIYKDEIEYNEKKYGFKYEQVMMGLFGENPVGEYGIYKPGTITIGFQKTHHFLHGETPEANPQSKAKRSIIKPFY